MTQPNTQHHKMLIGGDWVNAASGKTFETTNPYTREPWAVVPEGDAEDVDRAVMAARAAFEDKAWRDMLPSDRGRLLRRLADLVRRDADELALIESTDNGKLMREFTAQMGLVANWYEYFAGWADKIYGDVIPVDRPNILNYSVREPVGVVGAILP